MIRSFAWSNKVSQFFWSEGDKECQVYSFFVERVFRPRELRLPTGTGVQYQIYTHLYAILGWQQHP
jgi:hypothetical protein